MVPWAYGVDSNGGGGGMPVQMLGLGAAGRAASRQQSKPFRTAAREREAHKLRAAHKAGLVAHASQVSHELSELNSQLAQLMTADQELVLSTDGILTASRDRTASRQQLKPFRTAAEREAHKLRAAHKAGLIAYASQVSHELSEVNSQLAQLMTADQLIRSTDGILTASRGLSGAEAEILADIPLSSPSNPLCNYWKLVGGLPQRRIGSTE